VFLGTDFARRLDFVSYDGGPGLECLFEKFVPFVKRVFRYKGVDEKIVDKFILHNPPKAATSRP